MCVENDKPAAISARLTARKKIVFASCSTVAVVVFVEAVLWAAGVQPGDYWEDPYVGFAAYSPHFVPDERDPNWMVVAPSKESVLNPQRFLKIKPPGTYRIVCVGGSTVYGRPFFDETSFAGWLRELLPAADPSRNWEVINAGAISYASYRVAGLVDELCQYQPDLVVVYTGHNEFLERRTYEAIAERPAFITNSFALVNRLRVVTLFRNGFEIVGLRDPVIVQQPVLAEKVKAIPVRGVGPESYRRDDKWANEVVAHFEASLTRIVETSRQAKAKVLLVVPASNLANFAPFSSEHRSNLDPDDKREWEQHFDAALRCREAGDLRAALGHIDSAELIDRRHANLMYLKGQILKSLGDFDRARSALLLAREEDICPLRARESVLEVVKQVAARPDVIGVDFESLVYEQSLHGLPGHAMFHDHVHLTLAANRLLAEAILSELASKSTVSFDDDWSVVCADDVAGMVRDRIDRQKHARQLRALSALLASLGQHDEALWQAELSLELSGRTPSALRELASFFHRFGVDSISSRYFRESEQ